MARKGEAKSTEVIGRKTGTYQAFDREGTVMWECEDFVSGETQIPAGVSIAMRAGRIIDHNGAVLHTWDPYHLFGEKS